MLVVVLRYIGTVAWDSEVLHMSFSTSENWCAQSLIPLHGIFSGPAVLRGLTFCRDYLTSAAVTLRGSSTGGRLSLEEGMVLDTSK